MITATISQIAKALRISRAAVNQTKIKKGWLPVNDSGVDKFDVEALTGLRPVKVKGKELRATEVIKQYLKKKHEDEHLDGVATNLPAVRETSLPIAVVEPAPLPVLAELTKHQVNVMDARMWFIQIMLNRPQGQSIKSCQHLLVKKIDSGEQPYAQMAGIANDRKGKERGISQRTLMRWWQDYRDAGEKPAGLVPQGADAKRVEREAVLIAFCRDHKPGRYYATPPEVPAWLPYFLDQYRNPNKPGITDALRKMENALPASISMPTYEQARRICEKIPQVYLQKGRMTGAEYRSLCGFNRRDFSMDDPFTVGQIDGHSFKAYVAHPTTGAHFHPEVCGIICMTSKVLAGFSVGLAESAQTVADAFRHACTVNEKKPWGGVFAIVEADLGPGNKAYENSDVLIGRFARVGSDLQFPENAGNPQGHGGVERSNQSIWIRAAKDLPTYTGKDADRCTRKRIYTRLERDLKQVEEAGRLGTVDKTSKLLLSWQEFIDFLHQWVIDYNNTPHSSLPKISDPQTGRRRHMSPFEFLAMRMAEGWQPKVPDQDMLEHLFMPHKRVKINRCEFNLRGNRYHSYELHQYHGRELVVAYDTHNAEAVYVMDIDERLICKAHWNGNKITGQPTSRKEQSIQERNDRQTKLLERKLELRQAETRTAVVIEHSEELQEKRAALLAPSAEDAEIVERPRVGAKVLQLHEPEPEPKAFQVPEGRQERIDLWISINDRSEAGDESLTVDELRWHVAFRNSPVWKAWSRIHLQSVK